MLDKKMIQEIIIRKHLQKYILGGRSASNCGSSNEYDYCENEDLLWCCKCEGTKYDTAVVCASSPCEAGSKLYFCNSGTSCSAMLW